MSSAWPTIQLANLVENGEISYGIVQPGAHHDDGVPIVRVKDIRNDALDSRNPLRVAPGIAAAYRRTTLRGGELLLSIVGTVGESAIVPESMAGWNVARAIAVIRPKNVSSLWIKLCLQTTTVRSALAGALNTTVQATLNLADLKRLEIPVPPSAEREAITEVFGALGDKIANNRSLSRITDELLSSTFEDLRRSAPMGRLADMATVNAVSTRSQSSGQLRYLDISAVSVGTYESPPLMRWEDAPGRARRVVCAGDIVWSTVRPNRRSHALVLDESNDLVASTGLAVISPRPGRIAGVYESTRTTEFVKYLESVAEGSAYPAVRSERFLDAPIPSLVPELWEKFEAIALPMRKRVDAARRENRVLEATRDELLPLLMSGRIRVKDVEKWVEEVV
jgi:type I restriction enzyme S subunit